LVAPPPPTLADRHAAAADIFVGYRRGIGVAFKD